MDDYTIYQWKDLTLSTDNLKESTLILGNGASIAISEVFSYPSLFEKATSDQILNLKSKKVFEAIQGVYNKLCK